MSDATSSVESSAKKKNHVVGRPFKKGESGNPLGAAHPNYQLAMKRRRAEEESFDALYRICKMTIGELQDVIRDKYQTAIVVYAARMMIEGIRTGNTHAFNTFMDNMLGRPVARDKVLDHDVIADESKITSNTIDVAQMTNEELDSLEKIHLKYTASSPPDPAGKEEKKVGG